MGVWHHRIIHHRKSYSTRKYPLSRCFLSKRTTLVPFGELALSSAPYSSYAQDYQTLYVKDHIKLAVDGQIDYAGRTSGLSEYIMGLYLNHGNEALYRLEGNFSLILYDEEKQLTLLFSSFIGGNPLYYVTKNNLLSVSTNPVYLLHRPDVSDTLNSEEMSAYLSFDLSTLQGNVFSELSRVKSGEMVVVTPDNIKHIDRSFDKFITPEKYGSELEIIEKYRLMIERSVHKSLLPDVEHGIMLSSGMDSSTVAVFAKQRLDEEKRKLTAYSWTLPNDPKGDESKKIKELCKVLDIPLKLFNGEGFGPFDAVDSLFLLPDTPYMNPYWLINSETYRHASADGIGAMLNGAYGDMLYRGKQDLLIDIVRDRRFELLFPEIQLILKKEGYRNALKNSPEIRGLLRNYMPELLVKQYRRRSSSVKVKAWLSDSAKESRRSMLERPSALAEAGYRDFALALSPYQAGYPGLDRYLIGQFGIRRISSYIDAELIHFTRRVPTYMTYRNGQTKYFAREAMRGLLPESIRLQPRVGLLGSLFWNSFERKKKTVRERLLDDRAVWREYVDESWMERKFSATDTLDLFDLLVFLTSLNIQQWHKGIKPGGSLYEGKFHLPKRGETFDSI